MMNKEESLVFLETFRRVGFPVRYMAQECFNVSKQTLDSIEDACVLR